MKFNTILITVVIHLLIVCSISVSSDSNDLFKGNFDLTKLRKFYDDKDMDPNTKMIQLVKYLENEVNNPSRPRMGVGGGPIDTVYIQDVIIGVMSQTVPRQTLLEAFNKEVDEKIKERLMIALVSAGDKTFIPIVQSFLTRNRENILREGAMRALKDVNSIELEPQLLALKYDTYSRIVFKDLGDVAGYYKIYPIRQEAYEALSKKGAKPKGWILKVPLEYNSEIEAVASILDDENPEQCVTVIQALSRYPDSEAKKIINKFLQDSTGKTHLAKAVEEAKKTLSIIEKEN